MPLYYSVVVGLRAVMFGIGFHTACWGTGGGILTLSDV